MQSVQSYGEFIVTSQHWCDNLQLRSCSSSRSRLYYQAKPQLSLQLKAELALVLPYPGTQPPICEGFWQERRH